MQYHKDNEKYKPLIKYLKKTGIYRELYTILQPTILEDPYWQKRWGIEHGSRLYWDMHDALSAYAKYCLHEEEVTKE